MHPNEGQQKQYAQLYVVDSAQANKERINNPTNNHYDAAIMQELDRIIRSNNVLAQAYRTLGEVEREEQQRALIGNRSVPKVNMVFRRDRNFDRRRYNLPVVNEVAMIFRNDDGEPPFERDIRVYPRNPTQPFVNINILSPNMDPMTYALFYPFGEPGWQPKMQIEGFDNAIRRNVSMLQYKIVQTSIRTNEFNPLLNGGKLFQQWSVDSYLQVGANNLNFIRTQQSKLRVEKYNGLMDHLAAVANNNRAQIGRTVILPSTFQGSREI